MKYAALMFVAVGLIAATPTPPPSPPPLNATMPATTPVPAESAMPSSLPSATPTPNLDTMMGLPQRHGRHPQTRGTPTPPPQRKGLDGVWEVQIQRGANTEYEHMKLTQVGNTITGFYLTKDKKKYPVAGSLDDQNNVRLVVSLPDGSTILLEGRVDGTTDMLGMFTDSKERVPFTAAYRPKENWMENINATPGGLGTGGGPGGPP
ncbi:MAG TPA: hypothetical protein VMF11_09410 [Candidatus Baltobacteraceae bacterium]|nr:hypothetical protein [Candidatus Baltobacteraceae bacterium]